MRPLRNSWCCDFGVSELLRRVILCLWTETPVSDNSPERPPGAVSTAEAPIQPILVLEAGRLTSESSALLAAKALGIKLFTVVRGLELDDPDTILVVVGYPVHAV